MGGSFHSYVKLPEGRDCATTKTGGFSNNIFEDSGLRWFKQQEYELLIKDGLSQ